MTTGHPVRSYLLDVNSDTFDEAGWYEITIQGRLDARWSARFDGMDLATEQTGATVLRGQVTDQAALHGLLARVRDLGLPLLSVHRVPTPPGAETASP